MGGKTNTGVVDAMFATIPPETALDEAAVAIALVEAGYPSAMIAEHLSEVVECFAKSHADATRIGSFFNAEETK